MSSSPPPATLASRTQKAKHLKSTGYAELAHDRSVSDAQFRQICILAGAAPHVFFKPDGTPRSTGDRLASARTATLSAIGSPSLMKAMNEITKRANGPA